MDARSVFCKWCCHYTRFLFLMHPAVQALVLILDFNVMHSGGLMNAFPRSSIQFKLMAVYNKKTSKTATYFEAKGMGDQKISGVSKLKD